MNYRYVIDDREHHIIERIDQFTDIKADVWRMEIADIALLLGDVVVALFERKTIADLASSIKDGRYNNKEKMIEYRNEYDCKLYFIIEGDWSYEPNQESQGLPHNALESALFHLQMRDDIHIVHTKNVEDTIKSLNSFAKSISALHKKYPPKAVVANASALTIKKIKPDSEILIEIWCAMPGIGRVKARTTGEKMTIADYVTRTPAVVCSTAELLKRIPLCGKKTVEKMAQLDIIKVCYMTESDFNAFTTKKCASTIYKFLHIKIT